MITWNDDGSSILHSNINEVNFTYSKIIHITIKDINNNVICKDKNKFQTILKYLWSIGRKEVLLENTTYNMIEIDENNVHNLNESNRYRVIINGNGWQLSTSGKDANGAIKEIINMVKVNNYSIKMFLQIENSDKTFYYKY
jgi:hypothetical protein